MSAAREAILQAIARGRPPARAVPGYRLPSWTVDPAAHFIAKAKASVAHLHEIKSVDEVPASIWAIMTEARLPPHLHIPEIAETGTLVFLSGPRSPSSWHFRPGCEFALVMRDTIVPRFEDIAAILTAGPRMPATLNLVTGPSRTADIEQTIELGAHGPRDVHILIAG